MTKPTPQQLRALGDLRGNADVRSYLQDCLEDLKNRLVMVSDSEAVKILQGHAQAYQSLIDLIEGKTNSGKR